METFGRAEMGLHAAWCGRALALSHARSGCSVTLSGYMGKSDAFDRAMGDGFAVGGLGVAHKRLERQPGASNGF